MRNKIERYVAKPFALNYLPENEYRQIEYSLGIYTLYQNWMICNDQLLGKRIGGKTGEFYKKYQPNSFVLSQSHSPKLPIISYPPSAHKIKEENTDRHKTISITDEESTQILLIKIDQLRESMDEEYPDWVDRIETRIRVLQTKDRNSPAARRLSEQLDLLEEDAAGGLPYEGLVEHYSFIDTMWLALRDDLYLN